MTQSIWHHHLIETPKVVEQITSVSCARKSVTVRYTDGTEDTLPAPMLADHDGSLGRPKRKTQSAEDQAAGVTGFWILTSAPAAVVKEDTTLLPLPDDALRIDLLQPDYGVLPRVTGDGWVLRRIEDNVAVVEVRPNGFKYRDTEYATGYRGRVVDSPAALSWMVLDPSGTPVARIDAVGMEQTFELVQVHYTNNAMMRFGLDLKAAQAQLAEAGSVEAQRDAEAATKLKRVHTTDITDLRPWPIVDAALPHARRVLLYGPPGTGKTHVASTAGLKEGQKVYAITLTDETPMTELRGHFLLVNNRFVWSDGIAVRAWREGARLVLNEIDHAGGDVQSFLHVVLDDQELAQLALPTGEIVKPHPDFKVVATMNGVPKDLPMALRDRFPVTIEVNQVHPKALAKLAKDLQHAAKSTTLTTEDTNRRIGLRSWQEFDRLRGVVEPAAAARAVFGHRAQEILDGLRIAHVR